MDLTWARQIFQIDRQDFSKEMVDKSFKVLVKKYHPDRNREYESWCHERMTEINKAYEVLEKTLSGGHFSDVKEPPSHQKSSPKKPQSKSENSFFKKATTLFFEGVHIYFDYGLTKRTIRQEGVWRYHFRKAVKLMMTSIEETEKRYDGSHRQEVFLKFGGLFLDDLQSPVHRFPPTVKGTRNHIAYTEAVSIMEKSLTEYFSADRSSRSKYLSAILRASNLLIMVLEENSQNDWYALSLSKLNLIDSFLDLHQLAVEGVIVY